MSKPHDADNLCHAFFLEKCRPELFKLRDEFLFVNKHVYGNDQSDCKVFDFYGNFREKVYRVREDVFKPVDGDSHQFRKHVLEIIQLS
ncbi:hypothetical protein SDC9_108996 [bioreactor metagenome]|uniref:Uncharacterized protein n=1 Tax=bioreactor metagenome TaxID=1076179 RepID=A0A645B9H9_9ZZZZ